MAINERQRMQYLDAMGIDSFVPRVILPSARPSVACVLPVADTVVQQTALNTGDLAEITEDVDVASSASASAARSSISSVLSGVVEATRIEAPAPLSESSNTEPKIEPRKDESETEEAAHFCLQLWRAAGIQIIDSRQPGDALPTQTLLKNILSAVDGRVNLSSAEMLHWPLVEGHSGSWAEARQMVQGFLDARMATVAVTDLWLFGESAVRAVIGDELDFKEACFSRLAVDSFDVKALILPSLAEILYAPEQKRLVWAALAPFRSALMAED